MKPFDDMEPRDIAREVAQVIDGFTTLVANGGPAEASRAETVMLLQKSAALMRIWAEFGRWYTKSDLRAVARHAVWLDAKRGRQNAKPGKILEMRGAPVLVVD